jgi:hypothetical protein
MINSQRLQDLYAVYKRPLWYSFFISTLLSAACFNNSYFSTEDFTFANKMYDGTENATFIGTCIYDGKYTLYALFYLLKSLKMHDTLALAVPYLLLFKLQLIVGGILLIEHLKINISLLKTIIALSALSLYPYLAESVIYKHYFGFQSASFCYLLIVLSVLLLRIATPRYMLSIVFMLLCFGMYQTMVNIALCIVCTLTFIDLMKPDRNVKAVLTAFAKQLSAIALAGVLYVVLSKLFTGYASVETSGRISFIQNPQQVLSVFQSVGLGLARAFTQGVSVFNLVDRIAFLIVLVTALVYAVKQSALSAGFLILSLLSNFAVFFVINPDVGAILPRTLTSLSFFTFLILIWVFHRTRGYTYEKAYTYTAVIMLLSYGSVWQNIIERNVLNKKRDFALANAILSDVYQKDGFRGKEFFYVIGTDRIYDLEDKRSTLLAAHTNFSAFNNDQNFPHQLLRYVSGIPLKLITDKATLDNMRSQYPYESYKQKAKRFNIVETERYIIGFL